jgi:hypothetical protein
MITMGEYNCILDGIKISFGSSKALDKDSKAIQQNKALSSSSRKNFNMNFGHLRPHTCDVFVWMRVWTDRIIYWVLSANEALCNRNFI